MYRELLQQAIDEVYQQFKRGEFSGRKKPRKRKSAPHCNLTDRPTVRYIETEGKLVPVTHLPPQYWEGIL